MRYLKISSVVLLLAVALILPACQEVPSPLEDYQWVLTSYTTAGKNISVLPNVEVTALFDSETKQVSGNGGCNSYGGSYEVDGLDLTMTGPFYMTEMWCGDEIGEQERVYFEALQSAISFQLERGNLIIDCDQWKLYFSRK